MKAKHYRQGDVLIVRVNKLPNNIHAQTKNKGILAFGEVTGHSHRVTGATTFVTDKNGEAAEFIRVSRKATVKHEEHSPVSLPKGDYKVIIQTEFSPEGIRNVAD